MPEDIGGFYASLKLNVDSSSFNHGLSVLKQFKNEIAGITQLQRLLGKMGDGGGPGSGGGTRKNNYGGWGSKAAQDAARAEERNDRLMAYFAKEKEKRNKLETKNTEEMSTSVKWMVGAAVGAVAVFKSLASAIKEGLTASYAKGTQTYGSAIETGMGASKLRSMQNAVNQALGRDTGDSVGESARSIQQHFAMPQFGEFNEKWAKYLAVLANSTGMRGLDWESVKNMDNEERVKKISDAIKAMSKKDMAGAIEAGNTLLGATLTSASVQGNLSWGAGAATNWDTDKDIAKLAEMQRLLSTMASQWGSMWDQFSVGFANQFKGFLTDLSTWANKNKNALSNTAQNVINPGRLVWMMGHDQELFGAYADAQIKAGKGKKRSDILTPGFALGDIPAEFINDLYEKSLAEDKKKKDQEGLGKWAEAKDMFLKSAYSQYSSSAAQWYTKQTGQIPSPGWHPYALGSTEADRVLREQPDAPSYLRGLGKEGRGLVQIFIDNKLAGQKEIDFLTKNQVQMGLNQ